MRLIWDGYWIQFHKGKLGLWKDSQLGWYMGTHEVTIVKVTFWEGIKYLFTFNAEKWDQVFGPQ